MVEKLPNLMKNHRSKKLNKPQETAQHTTIKILKMSGKKENLKQQMKKKDTY